MSKITPHQKQALNYKEHISLTANAGSGKTFVLSKRYVEIALNENVSLRNIVAITFTEKAASELYKKVSDEINSRLLVTVDSYEKRKLEKLRQQLVSANISTIHSFCTSILREYPIESNIDANFVAIEQNEADDLIQLSIEEVIRKRLEHPDKRDDLKYLIRVFSSRSVLTSIISVMINRRKNVVKTASVIYSKSIPEIREFFYTEFKKFASRIIDKNKALLVSDINIVNEAVLSVKPDNPIAVEIRDIAGKLLIEKEFEKIFEIIIQIKHKILTKSLEVKKQGYLKIDREFYAGQIRNIEDFFIEIKDFQVDDDHELIEYELAKLGKLLIDLFNETLLVYTEKKNRNGYLDFEDLLLCTQKIMLQPEIANALGDKYKYIMVDEYQDTNEIQYEIFMPILDNLKKGNLFVVGDEKQSIYMFRDAELEVFNKTKVDITRISGEANLLNLPDSFRMAPVICLFTNYLFRRLFENPDISFNEVKYSDLVCAKDETTPGGIEIILADNEDSSCTEAELVARRVIKLLKENIAGEINLDDIAVLCRKRKSFEEIEKAFNKYRLPYNILGGKGFYKRQLVYDIYNYLNFLFNPKNDAALIGILRSPFFSLSDIEIFEISLETAKGYWEKFILHVEKNSKYKSIFELLNENLSLANHLDLTSLLRKITGDTNFVTVLASKPDSDQELANLEKLIQIASSFNSKGHRTLYDFINFINDAINSSDDEGQAAVTTGNNTVKVMTLHQAKGLEYKAVFLYSCHDYSVRDTVKTKSISINKELGVLTTVPLNNNYFEDYRAAPVVNLHNYIMKRKNIAEIKRLFYVGITRAKNYLFISGQNKEFKFHPESFMSFLFRGLGVTSLTERIPIEYDLTFLKQSQDKYYNESKKLNYEIPVIIKLDEEAPFETINIIEEVKNKKFKIQQIDDREEDEIISATRFAVFNQCPVKYQLTYELGYLNLFKNLKSNHTDFDFNNREERELAGLADIKGKIIHQILESEIPLDEIESRVISFIENELEIKDLNEVTTSQLKNEIQNDLRIFYESEIYKELLNFKSYKNGFEIYSKEDDYYLHGVINKLIFFEDNCIIIDYKTDDISADNVEKRALEYRKQQLFYGLLVNRLFIRKRNLEAWLIFLKHPSKKIKRQLTQIELLDMEGEIKNVIERIRGKNFTKNLNHCMMCGYYNESKCII